MPRSAPTPPPRPVRGEWNDANVLVMGYMGLVTEDAVAGILDAWFRTAPKPEAAEQIARLEQG